MDQDRDDTGDDTGDDGRERRTEEADRGTLREATMSGPPPADVGFHEGDASVKIGVPKGEGGGKDGALTQDVKEPKGFEAGQLDREQEHTADHHDRLAEEFDAIGRNDPVFEAPGADPLGGRDGSSFEDGVGGPGGVAATSQRETSQESPLDLGGPLGTGVAQEDDGPLSGKFGGKDSKDGNYAKDKHDEEKQLQKEMEKEAAKSGTAYNKSDAEALKLYKEATGGSGSGRPAAEGSAQQDAPASDSEPAQPETNEETGLLNLNVDPTEEQDTAVVQPADPDARYDGPTSISMNQTETFKNEYQQSQWDAKMGSDVTPSEHAGQLTSDAELADLDHMVTTPADPTRGGPPEADPGFGLVGGQPPIDMGPDHFEDNPGSGPKDPLLDGDFLYKQPKLSSTGSGSSTSDENDDAGLKLTDASFVESQNQPIARGPAKPHESEPAKHGKEPEPNRKYEDKYGNADDAQTEDEYQTELVDSTGAEIDDDRPVAGLESSTEGDEQATSPASLVDHGVSLNETPVAAQFGAGHVATQTGFGAGDPAVAATFDQPPLAATDHLHGQTEPDDASQATMEATGILEATLDDQLMASRTSGDSDSDDDQMEYDPSLEPLE